MKLLPAKQKKATPKAKPSIKRAQSPTVSKAKKVEAKKAPEVPLIEPPPSEALPPPSPPPPSLVPAPVFVRCDITGPDGTRRPGWEMWIGEHCFGRADSKELLMISFQRLQSPPESFHWREVRNRMQMRNRGRTPQPTEQRDESWTKEEEEPIVVEGEEVEGFQELTWENPA